jgi:hypothetical protein
MEEHPLIIIRGLQQRQAMLGTGPDQRQQPIRSAERRGGAELGPSPLILHEAGRAEANPAPAQPDPGNCLSRIEVPVDADGPADGEAGKNTRGHTTQRGQPGKCLRAPVHDVLKLQAHIEAEFAGGIAAVPEGEA